METARERGSWQSSNSECFRTPIIKSSGVRARNCGVAVTEAHEETILFYGYFVLHSGMNVAIFATD